MSYLVRVASEKVVLHCVTTKCIPVLHTASKFVHLRRPNCTYAQHHSTSLARLTCRSYLIKSSNIAIIEDCCIYFSFQLPGELRDIRFTEFLSKYNITFKHVSRYLEFFVNSITVPDMCAQHHCVLACFPTRVYMCVFTNAMANND